MLQESCGAYKPLPGKFLKEMLIEACILVPLDRSHLHFVYNHYE